MSTSKRGPVCVSKYLFILPLYPEKTHTPSGYNNVLPPGGFEFNYFEWLSSAQLIKLEQCTGNDKKFQ